MNRYVIVSGMLLASFLLFKFEAGEIGTSDLLTDDFAALQEEIEKSESKTTSFFPAEENVEFSFDNIEEKGQFDSDIFGAILPVDQSVTNEVAHFFAKLKNTQSVDTFVIVGENHTRRGKNNIATSEYGYETSFGNLDINFDYIEQSGLEFSYGAFREEPSISFFASYIKYFFPDAEIFPIAVKEFAKDKELEDIALTLADLRKENVVLIAADGFAEGISSLNASFHNELAKNVIETFDTGSIDRLDSDSGKVLKLAFEYFELLGAKKTSIESESKVDDKGFLIATFAESETVSDDRNLTIMAFGDMMLGRYVRTLMNQYGKDYIFEKIAGPEKKFFKGTDVVFGNFEGPINGEGTSGGTAMVFSFNEDVAPFLKSYGFNLLSLANNHAVDQGWAGRDSTIAAMEANDLGWCGHPSEADKESIYYGKIQNKKYAFICFHDVTYKLDDESAVNLIKEVRPNVDYVVVSIHWGYEYKHKPDFSAQIDPGHAFIDAGADFVIGHHSHVVQSFEVYKDRMIFYSLGNFVFDQYWAQMTQEELAIGIVLDDESDGDEFSTTVYLFPMKSEMSQSRLMTEEEYNKWILEFISYGDYSEEMKEMIKSGVIRLGNTK